MSSTSVESDVQEFKETLIKTKCCRINAYKRCCIWDSFYKVVACIYNLIVISLSIIILLPIDIFNENHTIVSALLVVAAVCTFALDLFLRVVNYGSQAEQYKNAYNELESILVELQNVENESKACDILKELRQRYAILMKNSANHTEQDYHRYVYENIDLNDDKLNDGDKKYYRSIKNKYKWEYAKNFIIKCGFTFFLYLFVNFFVLIVYFIKNLCSSKEE